uniref:GDSL esterase/lipase n=1 Tax=Ananas comosus var. bracteatus TaxID=296719 RepID=A0A6V7NK16_ANACO|nr:unnamed protein product [Ananas comosus var. bracteatus]
MFTFGDSIIDPGNNNHRVTSAKCNYPPYGKDFIGHLPTGRFSNGKLTTDFLVSGLGIKELLPPYLRVHLSLEDLLTGVSFASGGCGYDPSPQLLWIQNKIFELRNEESFRGTIVVYIDIYNILLDFIQRPYAYGFEESTRGCCGTGLIEVTALCNSITATTCPDDTKFVFWDSFHPTEKAYKIIADYILSTFTQTLS